MTGFPDRNHVAQLSPAPNWNQHLPALGGLYDILAELLGSQAPEAVTIVAGVITPARGSVLVDTEAAAASDDLATIVTTNLPEGRLLLLRPAANGRTVVVKHQAGGAGQIKLVGSADLSLDSIDKWVLLERTGADWRELVRVASAQGFLPLVGGSMTGAINEAKGAAVGSATTTNIWATDGNILHITGSTTIGSFGTAPQAGAERVLVFDAALTLTYGINLLIPGGANVTTATGDVAVVRAETATQHRIISYTRADGNPLALTGNGGNLTGIRKQGLETGWFPARSIVPRTTNGPSSGTSETTTNKVMKKTLDFDAATQEFAQFDARMPKSWNEGTVSFIPIWTAASGSGGVTWGLQGVALGDDDAIDAAFGTAQTSSDTLITAGDDHAGPASSAITIAGSPQPNDRVIFQINRTVSDGNDTLGVDAQLIGVVLLFTTNAPDDT